MIPELVREEEIPVVTAPVDAGTGVIPTDIPKPSTTTAEENRESAGRRAADRLLSAVHPPKTTAEEDRMTAGQRVINLIWENTQQQVAQWVLGSSLFVAISLALGGKFLGNADIQLAAVVFLFGVANLVTGFYFGRTNHQRTGGVGIPPSETR